MRRGARIGVNDTEISIMKVCECFQNSCDCGLGEAESANLVGGDTGVLKMTCGTVIVIRNNRFGV